MCSPLCFNPGAILIEMYKCLELWREMNVIILGRVNVNVV